MEKTKKLLLLTFAFFVFNVAISTLINYKNGSVNLMSNFEVSKGVLWFVIIVCLLPAFIPALIVCKIKSDTEKNEIIKQLMLVIIFLFFYYIVLNFVSVPLG
jgi:hypothetical protein